MNLIYGLGTLTTYFLLIYKFVRLFVRLSIYLKEENYGHNPSFVIVTVFATILKLLKTGNSLNSAESH